MDEILSSRGRPSLPSDPDHRSALTSRRHRVRFVFLLGFLLTIASAAAGEAQETPDPYATTEQTAKENDLDTDVTPVAKESDLWGLVHGTKFGETTPVADSVTTFDTDLFAVSFENRTIGLAGGSACAIPPERAAGEPDADFGRRATECRGTDGSQVARVPALYRYSEPRSGDPRWERLELPGEDKAGYIGAITWIDRRRALIVGGTGAYPRREAEADGLDPTDPEKADEAGRARAWVYERSSDSVRELALSAFTADEPDRAGMRGFTAADCFEDPDPKPGEKVIELCFAGALGQIWEWREGGFTGKRVDALSPADDLVDADLFHYRVRDLLFQQSEPPAALAVTAGCCAVPKTDVGARVLRYEESPSTGVPRRWSVRRRALCQEVAVGALGISERRTVCTKDVSAEADAAHKGVRERPDLPDSYYSLTVGSTIATPGTPEQRDESPSVITSPQSGAGLAASEPGPGDVMFRSLSTARLHDGDGDNWKSEFGTRSGGSPHGGVGAVLAGQGRIHTEPRPGADLRPDWAVGGLRSTRREGLGVRGLLVATALPPAVTAAVNAQPYVGGRGTGDLAGVDHPIAEEVVNGWEPLDEEKLEARRRSPHFLLPSYSANAIDIVGAEEAGWAVGDRGAILSYSSAAGGAADAAAESKPARLRPGTTQSLSPRGGYDSAEELPNSSGRVPGLSSNTPADGGFQLVSTGSPVNQGSLTDIVMSRDGSEGWAIGNAGGPTFYRFEAGAWRPCDPIGIDGVVAPDPACEKMAPLRGFVNESGDLATARLLQIARVPLENDDDPSNDDELEIIAIGDPYSGAETRGQRMRAVVRFSNGRWRFEDPAALGALGDMTNSSGGLIDLSFTSDDGGWLASRFSGSPTKAKLLHFDGERWIDCLADTEICGDSDGRIPLLAYDVEGLTAAGERVYLYGSRIVGGTPELGAVRTEQRAPVILFKDSDDDWTDGSGAGEEGGGLDPAFNSATPELVGVVAALSVAQGSDGYEGWAMGEFAGGAGTTIANTFAARIPAETVLLRAAHGDSAWKQFKSSGSYEDAMKPKLLGQGEAGTVPGLQVTYPSSSDPDATFVGQRTSGSGGAQGRIFGFDSDRQRFELLQSGRPQGGRALSILGEAEPAGTIQAMAPDGQGGFWASINSHFFHYTDKPPKPVFEEAPNPLTARESELRAISAGPDGSVWAASDSDRLYRYDRLLGWEEVRVPGWDPGRVVTRSSAVNAIALGSNGEGLAVGEGGRIAELSGTEVSLDGAAGRSCALGDAPPCSTSRDLLAVDLAPDGSALSAGKNLALLWRPAGGEFQAAARPPIASSTAIEAISYPTPSRAYLATDKGVVFRGDLNGSTWSWRAENETELGDLISVDNQGKGIRLRDIAVDASGHGYAVGDDGHVVERLGEDDWRRLPARYPQDLTSVELAYGEGEGVLIGGASGLILTGTGSELEVARHADFAGLTGQVIGFAYLPGSSEGSVDAWAALAPAGEGDSRLLRHRSDPEDPLLDPTVKANALPDAPPHTEGELSLASFGKSDCDLSADYPCPEMSATTTTNELVAQRIVEELSDLREEGQLDLAVLSGDATDSATLAGSSLANYDETGIGGVRGGKTRYAGQLKHRRYTELVADGLEDEGIPLLGAIGGQDLTETFACDDEGGCHSTKAAATAGENFAWREAFAGRLSPWGSEEDLLEDQGQGEIELEPVPGSTDGSIRTEDQSADLDAEGPAPEAEAEIGGANTHYAADVLRDGEPIARLIFADTSMRSLAASDPPQQPKEPNAGQTAWLERMICQRGDTTTTGERCTREKSQAAIVVSNTPTYSYGSGALTHTATDATTFEALLLKHDVSLVISGALGENQLYYTLAPGLHEPCPGGEHPHSAPKGQTPDCVQGPAGPLGANTPASVPDPASLLTEQGLSGAVPTLVSSGAGGKFGPTGRQGPDGPGGRWHGYSLARLLPGGDLAIEQRPILDWIGMDAARHVVRPRQKLVLRGYGRSPVSTGITSGARAFTYEISNAAITHRYDLLRADPAEPWLALEDQGAGAQADGPDACGPYVCLPDEIATVDSQSGEIKAGSGKHPPTYALAMLSVGDKAATYPLRFEPSPSFRFEAPATPRPTPNLGAVAAPGSPSTPTVPQIPSVSVPTPPVPPALVPPPPAPPATPPQPPVPPPVPPASAGPSALSLSFAPTGLVVAPTASVIPPPAPPINPAPPGGARKEARQRQAATQKSGADNAEGGAEAQHMGGDLADGPDSEKGSAAATRREGLPARQEHAFTRREQEGARGQFTPLGRPAASPAALQWGAGLTLGALVLALGFTTLRPRSRRREPELPAPAVNRVRR